jgi:hypothetical protein
MNNPQHTPGPWHTGEGKAAIIVYDAMGNAVCDAKVFHGKRREGESEANARLIASAPNLLEAAEGLLSLRNRPSTDEELETAVDTLETAIAKARAV